MVDGVGGVNGVNVSRLGGSGASRPLREPTESADGGGFASSIGGALDALGDAEKRVDEAAVASATGDLSSVSDYMVAATEAQLATEVTVAVRNRAIDSFNEIMRMQI